MDVLSGVMPSAAGDVGESRAKTEAVPLSRRMGTELRDQGATSGAQERSAETKHAKRLDDELADDRANAQTSSDVDASLAISTGVLHAGSLHARGHAAFQTGHRPAHAACAAVGDAIPRDGLPSAAHRISHGSAHGADERADAVREGSTPFGDAGANPVMEAAVMEPGSTPTDRRDPLTPTDTDSSLNAMPVWQTGPEIQADFTSAPAPTRADLPAREAWVFSAVPALVDDAHASYTHVFQNWLGKPFARVQFDLNRTRFKASVMTDDPDVFDALTVASGALDGNLRIVQGERCEPAAHGASA